MSEFTVTYDSCIEAARLASSRGDRLGAEQALTAAIAAAGVPGSEALLAAALMKLGELKRDAGSLAEAEEVFARAVEISDSVTGDDDVSLVAALTNLAGVRAVRGAPEDAEKLLTRALALSEKRLGHEHPDLVVLLNDLSRLYLKRSAFALAEPLLHRLHAIKRQKGEDHAEVATVLASLATVRQALGDHDAAENLWRRVLAIRERTLAPNHFAIATAIENLAETCSARGKVAEALRLFHRAVAMREMTLGMAHPSLRTLRERIADLQLQGADEFSGEELVPFAAPPVAVRIPPAAVYPTVEIAPPGARTSMPSRAPASAPRSAVQDRVAEPAKVMATAPLAAMPVPTMPAAERAAAALPEAAMPAVADPVVAMPPVPAPVAEQPVAAPAAVSYAQPKAPELEVPLWAEPEPVSPLAAVALAAQPMSIILPPSSDVDFDDDGSEDLQQDYSLVQGRMQRMSGSLGLLFRQRQTQLVAAGAVAVALVVVAAASQPRAGSQDPAAAPGATAQQYVAGGSTVVGDSLREFLTDSIARAAALAAPARETSSSERLRSEPSPAERNASERSAAKPPADKEETPAPARVPELPRGLSNISTANLDSAMRAAAPGRIQIAPAIEKPGFETTLGAVDYSDRAATKPALLIGAVPRIPYPQNLRVSGRETGGEVVVEFSVDTLGLPNMATVRIIRSDHELLAAAAYRAIPAMRFMPAMVSGRKTVGKVQLPFTFAITKEDLTTNK